MKKPAAETLFVLFFVVPLGFAAIGPAALNHTQAQSQCQTLASDRLNAEPQSAQAVWTLLPYPRWQCKVDNQVAAEFGWWASSTSARDAKLLD